MTPPTERHLTLNEVTMLWLGATRYYMGRMSYAVSDFTELLIRVWPTLPRETQTLIERDVLREFEADDLARQRGCVMLLPLGHDCDRRAWDAVLQACRVKAEGSK